MSQFWLGFVVCAVVVVYAILAVWAMVLLISAKTFSRISGIGTDDDDDHIIQQAAKDQVVLLGGYEISKDVFFTKHMSGDVK